MKGGHKIQPNSCLPVRSSVQLLFNLRFFFRGSLTYEEGETFVRILGKTEPSSSNTLTDSQLIPQCFGGYLSLPPAQWMKEHTQDSDVLEEAGKEM